MKNTYFLFFSFIFLSSCLGQEKPPSMNNQSKLDFSIQSDEELGDYIIELFEDSKENLWIGTLSKGVARYDGASLTYFTQKDGLSGNGVIEILEEKSGTLWFATTAGLSKYNGISFTNFTQKEGLENERVSKIFIDSKDNFWAGTWGSVYRFNGKSFEKFPLPNPDVEIPEYQETADWVTDIIEDQAGNIWFSRSGKAVCKYDPKQNKSEAFTHFTKADGLPSNCVQEIHEDMDGNIWFACRISEKDHPDPKKRIGDGGLCRYDGTNFTSFPSLKGLSKNDIYIIYEDKKGGLWIGANGEGLYHYDNSRFTLYDKNENGFGGIQSMVQDHNGTLWVGCSGGLYRLFDSTFVSVKQSGPWKAYNNLKDGKKIGLWREFYKNGGLKNEANYLNGKKDGLYKTWQKDGNLASEGYYRAGKSNGRMKWYHEGRLVAEGNMKDNKRDGPWRICDIEPGSFYIDAFFKEEVREGTWKTFYNSGKLMKEQIWKADKIVTEKCWDEMGIEIECETL